MFLAASFSTAVVAAFAAPVVDVPEGSHALRPVTRVEMFQDEGHVLALTHDDESTTLLDLSLCAVNEKGEAFVLPADRVETTWTDASGNKHTVITEIPGERDPDVLVRRHDARLRAMQRIYPPAKPQ
jgi:hypothetical protein